MFIHVPAAWMSMFVYMLMAGAGAVALVWNVKLAEVFAAACAPIGASFTALALLTGSLWGKPMWGAWWVWDARLTSELILLFLYIGVMALQSSIDDPRRRGSAAAILALVGVVNIPDHSFFRGVVEHAAPAGVRWQSRHAVHPCEHPRPAARHGRGVQGLFLHRGAGAHALYHS